MSSSGGWNLIESDPAVFTDLISGFGVRGLEFEEIWDLSQLYDVDPVGVIFLFKYVGSKDTHGGNIVTNPPESLFFAHQVIENACATQAIVSILLNIDDTSLPHVSLGETLSEFKSFTMDFPPDLRGEALSNSKTIREVHNSFARSNPFFMDDKDPDADKEDAFHFIAYVPVNGRLYELDGLKPGPIDHGAVEKGKTAWVERVTQVLQTRISSYESEIRFNLMAVVPNRLDKYRRDLKDLEAKLAKDADNATLKTVQQELLKNVALEEKKLLNYKKENARRRHNFIPFIYQLLHSLAKEGKLEDATKKAEEKASARLAAAAMKGNAGDDEMEL